MFSEFKNLLNNLFQTFLNLIFSQKCLICSCAKSDNLLCKKCVKDVKYLNSFAHKFYKNIPIYSCCNYDGIIKILIHKLKFQHKKSVAIVLAQILNKFFQTTNLKDKDFILIYPSSNINKKIFRGYEHMYLILKEFQKYNNFIIKKDLIKKIKYTKPQYSVKNKFNNIKNSFKVNYKNEKELNILKNHNILLIDDITTSGATIQEIINILLELDINNIFVLTISKAGN